MRFRDRPGGTFAGLIAGQGAITDQTEHRHLADAKPVCRLIERQLASLGRFAEPIDRDAVGVAETANPHLGPRVAAASPLAEPIQGRRDSTVGLLSRERPDQVLYLCIAGISVLACAIAWDAKARVISTPPVEKQLDPPLRQRDDNLLEDGAQDALACLGGRAGMGPGRGEIRAKRQQAFSLRSRQGWLVRSDGSKAFLLALDFRQSIVPALFELSRDQTVRGIDGIVLAAGEIGLVTRACVSASSACRRVSAIAASRSASAMRAASTPSGLSNRRTSAETAASTRIPPNEMQVCVP